MEVCCICWCEPSKQLATAAVIGEIKLWRLDGGSGGDPKGVVELVAMRTLTMERIRSMAWSHPGCLVFGDWGLNMKWIACDELGAWSVYGAEDAGRLPNHGSASKRAGPVEAIVSSGGALVSSALMRGGASEAAGGVIHVRTGDGAAYQYTLAVPSQSRIHCIACDDATGTIVAGTGGDVILWSPASKGGEKRRSKEPKSPDRREAAAAADAAKQAGTRSVVSVHIASMEDALDTEDAASSDEDDDDEDDDGDDEGVYGGEESTASDDASADADAGHGGGGAAEAGDDAAPGRSAFRSMASVASTWLMLNVLLFVAAATFSISAYLTTHGMPKELNREEVGKFREHSLLQFQMGCDSLSGHSKVAYDAAYDAVLTILVAIEDAVIYIAREIENEDLRWAGRSPK